MGVRVVNLGFWKPSSHVCEYSVFQKQELADLEVQVTGFDRLNV